jgi:hypothetical protein
MYPRNKRRESGDEKGRRCRENVVLGGYNKGRVQGIKPMRAKIQDRGSELRPRPFIFHVPRGNEGYHSGAIKE